MFAVLFHHFFTVHDINALGQRVHGIGRADAAAVEAVDGRGSLLAVNGRGGGDARISHFYNLIVIPRLHVIGRFRAFRNINGGEVSTISKNFRPCGRRR